MFQGEHIPHRRASAAQDGRRQRVAVHLRWRWNQRRHGAVPVEALAEGVHHRGGHQGLLREMPGNHHEMAWNGMKWHEMARFHPEKWWNTWNLDEIYSG